MIAVEQLKFRLAIYHQLTRLPKGTRFVKQDGFREVKSIKKYCAIASNGVLIATNVGNNLKDAKSNALIELNNKLRYENLIWGNR